MATDLPLASPFGTEPLEEVPLPRAPLARTLTQIRFPNQSVLALSDDAASSLALAVRSDYPVFNVGQDMLVTITPDGVTQTPGAGKVWRLSSSDETWQVSLAANFLSLDTSTYTSRDDFGERLASVWAQFVEIVGTPAVQRIGFRYVNRVEDRPFLDGLSGMVRPEVMGATFAGASIAPIARSLTENLYVRNPQDQLLARWGILPPGTTLDPTIVPASAASWVLDLDSYRTYAGTPPTDVDVPNTVKELGKVGYRFFRWAVTDDFLRYFGGEMQ